MTLRNLSLNLELGQTILVGPNNKPAQITKWVDIVLQMFSKKCFCVFYQGSVPNG